MSFVKSNDNFDFNLDNAKYCLGCYSKSVDVNCVLIDSRGDVLYSTQIESSACGVCKNINKSSDKKHDCQSLYLYGSYQAERFGGGYVFFCPFGLVHWAAPIVINGTLVGSMIGGPVLMMEPEDFLMDELMTNNGMDKLKTDELMQAVKEVPIRMPDVVNSYSELLSVVAAYASNIKLSSMLESKKYLTQQSNISEYIQYIKTMGGEVNELPPYPLEKEKELLSLISVGDRSQSQKVLNEIFGHIFFQTGGNFQVMKARVLELVVLLSRAALEGGADVEQIFGLNYNYLNEINEFHAIEDLAFWLSGIMARFTDCVFNFTDLKHVDVIYKSMDYIKRNYMKKITLEEVASVVYLSSSYFSKIFKDEVKTSFINYLNKVRIEASKKLLLDDKISIVGVSNLVGYEDQSYFSKVFKKLVGISPGKFRETRGKIAKFTINR